MTLKMPWGMDNLVWIVHVRAAHLHEKRHGQYGFCIRGQVHGHGKMDSGGGDHGQAWPECP